MKHPQMYQDYPLTGSQIEQYRRDGFIKLDDVITGEELQAFRDAVAAGVKAEMEADVMGRDKAGPGPKGVYEQIFIQRVNLWQRHPAVREFAFAPRLANIAARLIDQPVRIWHDHALFKEAKTGSKTPWHQDAPYWPHEKITDQLSIWIALKDATIKNGCMSFLPGTHQVGPKPPVRLSDPDPKGVYELVPEAKGVPAVTHELKAGSVTFHNGLCFHYAGPNRSDETREAYVVIYMPADTRYSGLSHVVTDGMGLKIGGVMNGDIFPVLSTQEPVAAS